MIFGIVPLQIEDRKTAPIEVMVDTGSELSWLPKQEQQTCLRWIIMERQGLGRVRRGL